MLDAGRGRRRRLPLAARRAVGVVADVLRAILVLKVVVVERVRHGNQGVEDLGRPGRRTCRLDGQQVIDGTAGR